MALLLMTPGPTRVPERVLAAGAMPMIDHRTDEFCRLLASVVEKLRPLFGTSGDVLPLHSTGRGALEAAITNLCSPGDEVIVCCNGRFGEMWADNAEAFGVVAHRISRDWGAAVDPAEVEVALRAHPHVRAVLLAHSDTSTGALNDVAAVARISREAGVLVMVDGVSSIGGTPFRLVEWGVDLAVTASQKCLMSSPGLAFVALSERAWKARSISRLPRSYFDLEAIRKTLARSRPETPGTTPVHLIAQVHAALEQIDAEGINAVYARHAEMAQIARNGAARIGLLAQCPGMTDLSPTLTGLRAPDDVAPGRIREELRARGILVAKGLGCYESTSFRIGHMGDIRPADVRRTLDELAEVLAAVRRYVHSPTMSGQTISEKILSRASHHDVRAGDLAVCDVDVAMGTDASVPMALDYFEQMGGAQIFDASRVVFVFDHYADDPSASTFPLQARTRKFAQRHGVTLHDCGAGICHQLMAESGRVVPGRLLVGADSHTVTGGALNAFATGIGSSDLAATMICGRIWLKVPETIRVTLTGETAPGVYAKDIALALARRLGVDGAAYKAIEFDGPGASSLEVEDRIVLSNMSVEMGAKAGMFRADIKTAAYLASRTAEVFAPVEPDSDAVYASEIHLDVSQIGPVVALPHQVDSVVEVDQCAGTPVQMVFIGTCTGGRARDIHQAARILAAAGRIAPDVALVVVPASREAERRLRLDGTLDQLASVGATILPSGCGPCCGTAPPIPAAGANVISTANRNFKARMGCATASIYLASPATCAASAVTGRITDPRTFEKNLL